MGVERRIAGRRGIRWRIGGSSAAHGSRLVGSHFRSESRNMAAIKNHHARWLIGAGWICCLMQLFLDLGLVFHIKDWTGGDLGVFLFFVGFPFGLGLAIALLLLRRWVVAIVLFSMAAVTWQIALKAASEVQGIPAPQAQTGNN